MLTADDHAFLRTAIRAFKDEPLDPEDARYVPLYEDPALGLKDPVQLLARGITLHEGRSTQLLVGPTGSGRSTILKRLGSLLRAEGYVTLLQDATELTRLKTDSAYSSEIQLRLALGNKLEWRPPVVFADDAILADSIGQQGDIQKTLIEFLLHEWRPARLDGFDVVVVVPSWLEEHRARCEALYDGFVTVPPIPLSETGLATLETLVARRLPTWSRLLDTPERLRRVLRASEGVPGTLLRILRKLAELAGLAERLPVDDTTLNAALREVAPETASVPVVALTAGLLEALSPALRVEQMRLRHVRLFEDVTIDLQGRDFSVILAENGHGKTTVLQCMAMALSGHSGANALAGSADAYFDRRSTPEEAVSTPRFSQCSIEVDARVDAPTGGRAATGEAASLSASLTLAAGSKVFEGRSLLRVGSQGHPAVLERMRGGDGRGWFVAGYGVGRTLPRHRGARAPGRQVVDRLRSLFDPDPPIATGFAQLLEDLQGIEAARAYTDVLTQALAGTAERPGILPSELSIRLQRIELRGSGRPRGSTDLQEADRFVLNVGPQTLKLPASWLSAGFQSTIAWVADLIGQYALSQGRVVPTAEMEGLVLIDEIDLHLHPRWQVGLVPSLKRVFPQMQFVVTTHSPMVLATLSAHEVMMLAQGEDGSLSVRESHTTPALKTGSELYDHFFGIDRLYPSELGEQFQRYSFLSSNPYRDDAEESEMLRLREVLKGAGVDPGWEPEARIAPEKAT